MTQKRPASAWMRRHLRDPYVKQAVQQGYRSRAAFKLIELDQRDRLFRPGMAVVDLGSAPGGWSQVAAERVAPSGRVIAVDLLPMQPVVRVCFIRGDGRATDIQTQIFEALGGQRADLVLSDMAPNLTGVAPLDEARSQELVQGALACARSLLKPGGRFVVKVFHGSGLDAVMLEMRAAFRTVVIRKPSASRSASSEVYAVCDTLAAGT